MSDFRAIAGVSASIRNLLRDRMEDPVTVTIAPPDLSVQVAAGRRINLYLYQVTEHGFLKNQDIPGCGLPGSDAHPPLSLILTYMLTTYGENESGADSDLSAQRILGDALRVLHDYPILTEDLRQLRDPSHPPILDPSLIGACEQVKLTLQPTALDEFSKIWSALSEANFRRSVAYQASVVQIESRRPRRIPLPVSTRRIHVAASHRPEITTVYRTPASDGPTGNPNIAVGQSITIEGHRFLAPRTWVKIGRLEPIQVEPESDETITLFVPDDLYPADADHPTSRPIPAADQLQPGPQTIEVQTRWPTDVVEGGLDQGHVVSGEAIQRSNLAVFMLVPQVTSTSPSSGPATTVLTVNGHRLYQPGLACYVLIGDHAIEIRLPRPGDSWAAPTPNSVQVPLSELASGESSAVPGVYRIRVLVNGAQSLEEGMTFQLT